MKAFIEQFGYGCISPHCKRCQTQYSIHSELLYNGVPWENHPL